MSDNSEHLILYNDKHVFIDSEGSVEVFRVGDQSDQTKEKYEGVKDALADGYFENRVDRVYSMWDNGEIVEMSSRNSRLLSAVMAGVNGQGRGIAGVLLTQLVVKSIDSSLTIRLPKGNRSDRYFSWERGISLRALDNDYISPVLDKRNLIGGNTRGGSMMTRSLSTNLPYTKVTHEEGKRGPSSEWLEIVDLVENDKMSASTALDFCLMKLLDMRAVEQQKYEEATGKINQGSYSREEAEAIIRKHILESSLSSELMEVAAYSIPLSKNGVNTSRLLPHRAADSKSGQKGDIEILEDGGVSQVYEVKFLGDLTEHEKSKLLELDIPATIVVPNYDTKKSIDTEIEVITLQEFADKYAISGSDWLSTYNQILGKKMADKVDFNHHTGDSIGHLIELL